MKYVVLSLLALASYYATFAQNERPVVRQRVVSTCETTANEAIQLIPYYLSEGLLDSARYHAELWREKCGRLEYNERVIILLDLYDDTFSQFSIDYTTYNFLIDDLWDQRLKELIDSVHQDPLDFYNRFYNSADLILPFNKATTSFGKKVFDNLILQGIKPCDMRYQVAALYSGHITEFVSSIKNPDCSESRLSRLTTEMVHKVENKKLVHAALTTGIWIPQGDLAIVGNHPSLGFLFGFGTNRLTLDLLMEFRFLKSKEPYYTMHQGNLIETDDFFGGCIGVNATRNIAVYNHSVFYAGAGLAFDGMDVVESDPSRDVEGKSINSYNINLGGGYRWEYRKDNYLGIDIRYNFVDYRNGSGTSLQGNTVTMRLVFGILSNDTRRRQLKEIDRLFR